MRMWEIRENSKYSDSRSKDTRDEDSDYDCGYEDGYEAAMKEMERSYRRRR